MHVMMILDYNTRLCNDSPNKMVVKMTGVRVHQV